ncbi:DUF4097 family beta strand repeat-containing protein [Streptomyces sp. NPDC049585]|uniref:DUF4097 family beta strand repeat-containing protein n=1 Tax=Streptomyces sp. NPDC049585 TaxID=3155154 RepID=UPI0034380D3C
MAARATRAVRLAVRLSALVAGVLVLAGCGSVDPDDAALQERVFSVAGRELTVDSDNSALELVPTDARQVKVTRWFRGWALGGAARVSWDVRGDTLRLRMHCTGITVRCAARHRIEVPRALAVTVRSTNGPVGARGFAGHLAVRTTNGAVRVREASGALALRTTNGTIEAKAVGSPTISAASRNGAIRISTDRVPDRVETRNGNGSTRIALPRAPYKVDAGSRNGSVTVGVPRDGASAHAVTARGGNGDVEVRDLG